MSVGTTGISTLDYARHLLRSRHRRCETMPDLDVGDLCWTMLLELFVADAEQQTVPISAACMAANAPVTTALRYLNRLCAAGKVVRTPDPQDQRRILVAIAPDSRAAVHSLLAEELIDLHGRAKPRPAAMAQAGFTGGWTSVTVAVRPDPAGPTYDRHTSSPK